jgi:NitT/TauT family transport system substrate-binding protein
MSLRVKGLRLAMALLLGSTVLALGAMPAAAQTKLIVHGGSPSPNIAYINLYVGQQAGLFKEEGLEVEVRYASGAAMATQITASDGADIGDVTYEPFLLGYEKGLRGKFFYDRYDHNIFFIGVPEDSPIKTVQDLAGKKIGVSNMGSSSLNVANSMLRGAGLTPSQDIFVPVGIGDSAITALKTNQIQAYSLFDAAYAGLERSGLKLRYIQHPTIGKTGNGGYFASDRTLARKRGEMVKFVRAMIKAHVFIRENTPVSLKMYWTVNPAARVGATEADALKNGMQELRFAPFFSGRPDNRIGKFDLKGLEAYLETLGKEGVVPPKFTVADFVRTDLVEEAHGGLDLASVATMARNWK